MACPKAPGKGSLNPLLPGGHQPHALPQPRHSPESCGPHPSTLDSAPMAALDPDPRGKGRGVRGKPLSGILKPSGQQEKELKSMLTPGWDTFSPW